MFFFTCSCSDLSQEEVEKLIEKSPVLARLDQVCRDVPKPDDFRLSYKKISGNSQYAIVSHRYQSDEDFEDVKNFFFDWFRTNGWILDERMTRLDIKYFEFTKNKMSIAIERVNFPTANYSIDCEEEVR